MEERAVGESTLSEGKKKLLSKWLAEAKTLESGWKKEFWQPSWQGSHYNFKSIKDGGNRCLCENCTGKFERLTAKIKVHTLSRDDSVLSI